MFTFISSKETVVRRDYRRADARQFLLEEWSEQHLVKTTRVLGIPVFRQVIDRERIPDFAIIEEGCFGETSWRSKFSKVIDAQRG